MAQNGVGRDDSEQEQCVSFEAKPLQVARRGEVSRKNG